MGTVAWKQDTKMNEEQPQADNTTRSFFVCGIQFDVDIKYQLGRAVGKGAYGVVWCVRLLINDVLFHSFLCSSAKNVISNQPVAIKKYCYGLIVASFVFLIFCYAMFLRAFLNSFSEYSGNEANPT